MVSPAKLGHSSDTSPRSTSSRPTLSVRTQSTDTRSSGPSASMNNVSTTLPPVFQFITTDAQCPLRCNNNSNSPFLNSRRSTQRSSTCPFRPPQKCRPSLSFPLRDITSSWSIRPWVVPQVAQPGVVPPMPPPFTQVQKSGPAMNFTNVEPFLVCHSAT
jgi:hypothetical protein